MTTPDEYSCTGVFAALPRTTRGAPIVLGAGPKGDKIIYCGGNSVYTLDLNTLKCIDVYTEHSHPTTVAKMAPSGFYMASGDSVGNVRIWDTTQTTHILKNQFQVISGPIRDITWSDDSKRLAAVGEGRERFGHAFLFDTGTSNGDLSGQSRPVSTVDFRPCRPYRLITGSEDNTVAIFEGPPFKFKTTFHDHSRFVWVTRYSPDGKLFASAGADGKVILFEGTDGTKQGELVDEKCKGAAHGGSVFGMAWSPDGTRIATASGDKTVKVWNVESRALEKTVVLGSAVEDQQLSCAWTASALVSASLSGFLNIIDPDAGTVKKVIVGHNRPITGVALSSDKNTLLSTDSEGHITRWDLNSGDNSRLPQLHKTQISGIVLAENGTLLTVAFDDTLQQVPNALSAGATAQSTKLASQPLGVAASSDAALVAAACNKQISIFRDGKHVGDTPINYVASCVAVSVSKGLVAVGGQDNKVHVYTVSGATLAEKKVLSHNGAITAAAFSPDGSHLAVTDAARKVVPYSVEKDFVSASSAEWTFHSARVNCVGWSPCGRRLATGGIDTNIMVWDLDKSGEHPVLIKGAHAMSPINGVVWRDAKSLISAGQDGCIKTWTV